MKASEDFSEIKKELMQNPKFIEEYEKSNAEFDIIRAILDTRTSQNLTQKQLSEKTGISRSDISRLENGTRNPTIKLLQKLADGLDMDLKIEFIPRNMHA